MINKMILVLISILLVGALVTALEVRKTEFVINTEPYQNLSIRVINADTKGEMQVFEGRARKFGEYRFTYYGTIAKVSLAASIVNNATKEVLKEKTFGPFTLGAATETIDFYLSGSAATANDTVLNSSSQIQNSDGTENPSIQGAVINESSGFSNKYYYVGAGVLAALVLAFVFRKQLLTRNSSPSEPKPAEVYTKQIIPSKKEITPQVSASKKMSKSGKASKSSINETEKRIADLQKQLDEVRNEEKLVALQKQLNQEKKTLSSMTEGSDSKGSQKLQTYNEDPNA